MDRSRSNAVALAVGAIACAGLALWASAGDLDPPGGPVGPTMKTLREVEPRAVIGPATTPGDTTATYVIDQPGSYYLGGELVGESGKSGIRVEASDVSIDLCGFRVVGVSGSWHGIECGPSVERLHLRNGTIVDWGARGVHAPDAENTLIEWLLVHRSGVHGLLLGAQCMVRSCVASDNGVHGFFCTGEATMENCAANDNTLDGIQCTSGGSLTRCTALRNGENGISTSRASLVNCAAHENTLDGFYLTDSLVTSCVANENGDDGFELGRTCFAFDCLARGNGGGGFYVAPSAGRVRVDTCSAHNNWWGVRIDGTGCFVARNHAKENFAQDFTFAGSTNSQYGPVVSSVGDIGAASPWANFGVTVFRAEAGSSLPEKRSQRSVKLE